MEALFVRPVAPASASDLAEPKLVADLVHELENKPEIAARIEVARSPTGPFTGFPQAFEDAALREIFALATILPARTSYRKVRPCLFLGLFPLLMLLELDRELAFDAVTGSTPRVLLDLLLVGIVARDFARPLPRHPLVSAAVLFGAASRFTLLIARSCGHEPHAIIYFAPVLAAVMAVVTAVASPSPRTVVAQLHAVLGIEAPPPSRARVRDAREQRALWPALAIAILLPPALWLSGKIGGLLLQGIVMVAWGLALPQLASKRVDDLLPRRSAHYSRLSSLQWGLVGVALTAGLTGGVHYLVDAVAQIVACTGTSAAASATSFVANESREASKGIFAARENIAFFVMTVGLSPLIEERVYRGMLQRIASERFGSRRGIALASVVFGLAHLGVYRVAVYQTILLGVAFGVAFEEGGLVASLVTHAVWNLYLLL